MPLGRLGVIDLSIVTDRLVELLNDSIAASPMWTPQNPEFTINVSGNAPDSVRSGSECELSLFLFHLSQDKFQMNTPAAALRAPIIPFQPQALDLYYLLSAYADNSYVQEQQAMSIALRCFHQNPIVRETVVIDGVPVREEFTLTMGVDTADEVSRLWQATTSPMRLSAVFRVSVVFMSPEAPARPIAPRPARVNLGADPTSLPFADLGQVTGTRRTVTYRYPSGAPAVSRQATYNLSPATGVAGQRLLLVGGGLNQPSSSRVYLVAPNGVEAEITAWKAANPAPPGSLLQTDSRITLNLPSTVGAPPANTPQPGLYQLRVGSNSTLGDPTTTRSNSTAFAIAPRIDVNVNPPLLTDAGGMYAVAGAGFAPGATEVLLGTVALAPGAGAPGAGEFVVNGAGTAITFQAPLTMPAGRHALRIRVNGVEGDPSWWIDLP